MTATVDFDRAAWLAWRRQGIGASDVAAILGLSPWASPWSVWADKLALLPDQPDDEYMAAGRWLERAIGPWFADETGLHVAGEQTWCQFPKHPHHRCTVDGFVFEYHLPPGQLAEPELVLPDALGGLEIKVTGPGRRWEEIPAHYQAQGQWQMHVTGLERVWFAVLMGRRLDIHELERDQADIDLMAERVDDFWNMRVLTAVPPEVDGSDATTRALAAVYPEHTPGTSVQVLSATVDGWLDAKARKRLAEGDEKGLANEIRAQLGDAEEGTVDGVRVVSWRAQTRTTTCKHCGAKDTSDPFRVLRHHPPKEKP